jgi:polysaccharide biosynthesis protein PelF
MPDLTFSVAHLGEPVAPPVYAVPPHVRVVPLAADCDPEELPGAAVYHALSTGAAGAVAGLAAARRDAKLVLSEHGLAWLEARLGIVGCRHGPKGVVDPARVAAQAREAYARAFAVTSVCSWNARLQTRLGARRVRLIENPAASMLERRDGRDPRRPLVGLVGRVVPVKDVATFLRACRLVALALPHARFVVIGPLDHDPEYAARCRALAGRLGLAVELTGATDPGPWYRRLDALVLTSRSEAQPLVALEAMAAGVPVVATDVGGCRELLSSRGLVTPPGDARATAACVLRVLRDEDLRCRLVAAGRERVRRRHDPARTFAAFRDLYEAAAA